MVNFESFAYGPLIYRRRKEQNENIFNKLETFSIIYERTSSMEHANLGLEGISCICIIVF